MTPSKAADQSLPVMDRARRRITRRLMPFLLILFLIAFLDRTNVSVAAIDMKKDLGFTEDIIGNGAGIFFLGYFILEIPGTLLVERWSARKWIARIMISWGILATLMGFIGMKIFGNSAPVDKFNWLRFILGLAEAGFFPGVMVYLAHWFRYEDRGKAKSLFLIGIPLATIIALPVSQAIMQNIHWLGLSGWRWVYILEGIPAVIMGFVTIFFLTDRPEDAKWLPDDEKAWISQEIESERIAKASKGGGQIWRGLLDPQVLLMAAIYLLAIAGMYGLTFFLPSITAQMKGTSKLAQTVISMLPYILGFSVILLNGAHSDRTGERKWHTAIPLLLAGGATALCAHFSADRNLSIICLCLMGVTLYAYLPAFWTHPTARLTASSAALAIGFINSVGNLGGYIGPKIVGELKKSTGTYEASLWFLAKCIFVAGILALFLSAKKNPSKKISEPVDSLSSGT